MQARSEPWRKGSSRSLEPFRGLSLLPCVCVRFRVSDSTVCMCESTTAVRMERHSALEERIRIVRDELERHVLRSSPTSVASLWSSSASPAANLYERSHRWLDDRPIIESTRHPPAQNKDPLRAVEPLWTMRAWQSEIVTSKRRSREAGPSRCANEDVLGMCARECVRDCVIFQALRLVMP